MANLEIGTEKAVEAGIRAGIAPGPWDRNRPGHWVSRSLLLCLPGSVTHKRGAKWTHEKAGLGSLLGRKTSVRPQCRYLLSPHPALSLEDLLPLAAMLGIY